jgi:hypothetical protein
MAIGHVPGRGGDSLLRRQTTRTGEECQQLEHRARREPAAAWGVGPAEEAREPAARRGDLDDAPGQAQVAAMMISNALLAVYVVLPEDIPANSGMLKLVEVTAPEGTVVNRSHRRR